MTALLLDLYELTMGESYLTQGIAERPATFQLFCRSLPPGWGYLVACGVDDALDYLEGLRFEDDDIEYLRSTGLFGTAFLDRLAGFRFTGEVRAMREGTVFFPAEPIMEITGPLLEAQLVETLVVNHVHFGSLVAAKASRCVEASESPGMARRRIVEFGLRRTHSGEAGLAAARAAWIAGFDATSNVLAGRRYGIPIAGTMAHSYVECFENERAAFEAYTRSYPDGATLLIDTYDTVEGARTAALVARELATRGGWLGAVRLDSGDLLELSRRVRSVLDEAGLPDVTIFASGNLDEHGIARLLAAGAPIDGFGVGSRLGAPADAPTIDLVYKLVSFDGRPVLKLSPDKETLPGAKQAWRRVLDGRFAGDVISLLEEDGPEGAEPLLEPAIQAGRRAAREPLDALRARAAAQRAALPPAQRALEASPYPVSVSRGLEALRAAVAQRVLRA